MHHGAISCRDGRVTYEIIKQTGPGGYSEGAKKNTREAARILRVLCFHRLTDWYGSIPYFEANRGVEGIFQPKYDKQKDIYYDLLKELDEACSLISSSNLDDGFSAADYYFNGDIAKWKKFGYSLMLRLAMRISNVDLPTANTYVTKAVAGGVMSSNDDNVIATMALGPSEWTNQNGISRGLSVRRRAVSSSFRVNSGRLAYGTIRTLRHDDPRLMSLRVEYWNGANSVIYKETTLKMRGFLPAGRSNA